MFILNVASRLNAPTGAWCSLTRKEHRMFIFDIASQCTYRCVVLPDKRCVLDRELYHGSQCTYRCVVLPDPPRPGSKPLGTSVSMHLQVRGAP